MPGETKYKRRHKLRSKDIDDLSSKISAVFGCQVLAETDNVELAEVAGESGREFVLIDGVPVAIFVDGVPVLTVRGLLKFKATKAFVESIRTLDISREEITGILAENGKRLLRL